MRERSDFLTLFIDGLRWCRYFLQDSLTIFRLVTRRSPASLRTSASPCFLSLHCLFFLGFLCLAFVVTHACNGLGVADVLVQLNGLAAQFPGLAILAAIIANSSGWSHPTAEQPVTITLECMGLAAGVAGAAVFLSFHPTQTEQRLTNKATINQKESLVILWDISAFLLKSLFSDLLLEVPDRYERAT